MPIGCRIAKRAPDLDPALLDAYRGAEVSIVGDAMQRARVFQMVDPAIRPLGASSRLFGRALTVRIPPGDFLMVHKAMHLVEPGDVVVVDARGDTTYAVGGAVMAAFAQKRGAAGLLVDGAYRDITRLREMGFPVHARAVSPIVGTLQGPGEINTPVNCGGVVVDVGDFILADEEGIIVVPWRHAAALVPLVRARQEREDDYWARLDHHAETMNARWDKTLNELGCVRDD